MRLLQLAEPGKELVDQRLAPASLGALTPRGTGATRFSATVRLGNTLSRSGTSTMPRARDLVRQPVLDALALEDDRAFGDAGVVDAEEARDRAQRRGLAGAVGAEQRDDLPVLDRKRDALHRGDGALIDHLELFDGQQRLIGAPPRRGRCLNGHSRK